MNHLYIIRGLPGSGKSTLANKLTDLVVEADMYFTKDGVYKFVPKLLREAHIWCYETVVDLLKIDHVTVANTFSQVWEMKPYLELPNPKTIITCEGNYGNIHNVPNEVIQRMKDRWEHYS